MTAEALVIEREAKPNATPAPLLAAIRMAKAGDERAFEEIMLATERRVATVAWRILGDAEETKEAVQETFLRVFRHVRRYDETQDFFGWLFRIAVNVCRDLDRRRKRRRSFFEPIDPAHDRAGDEVPADDALARLAEVARVREAIDALPEKERLAIILREVEELSTDEVAAILGSTPTTVRVQISKARAKLRQWIGGLRR